MANPAMYNFYTQAYPNAADYNLLTDGPDVQGMYSVYQEGIYLDYRYYETRYEDAVMGTGNAGDYNWSTTVAFPFGYGDSYTTFEYSDFNVTESADAFNVTLKVTNTGSTYSGKETVQLYFQSPTPITTRPTASRRLLLSCAALPRPISWLPALPRLSTSPLTRASCAPMMPTTPRPILLTLATTTLPLPPMHTTL